MARRAAGSLLAALVVWLPLPAAADEPVAPAYVDELPVPGEPPAGAAWAQSDRALRALALLGTPYRRGGSTPEAGFDCSGFVAHVFRLSDGTRLPRTAAGMYRYDGAETVPREAIQAGDLLFFRMRGRRIDHVAIALGDGRFVHAPATGGVVRVERLDDPWWSRQFAGARRILTPLNPDGPAHNAPLSDLPDNPPAGDPAVPAEETSP